CGSEADSASEPASDGTDTTAEEYDKHDPENILPAAPTQALEPGRAVFVQVCSRCHIESEYAPTINDTRDWKRRYAKADDGINTFYDNAINGFGDMLAKGGKRGAHLTDDQVRQAVDYAFAVTGADQPRTDD
ncbi:MAG: c-type cytochrome, partial [Planctomycetota bacterium]